MTVEERVLDAFRVEHREHLESIRQALQRLDEPRTTSPAAELDEMYRLVHTLKGGARICGLDPIEKLSHAIESLFARCRDNQQTLESELTRRVQQALDVIEDWMLALDSGGAKPDVEQALSLLEAEPRADSSAPQSDTPRQTNIGHAPPQPEPEAPAAALKSDDAASRQPETLRIGASQLDRLLVAADELSANCTGFADITAAFAGVADRLSSVHRELRTMRAVANANDSTRSLEELDSAIVGALHEVRRISRLHAAHQWQVTSSGRALQRCAREARLVTAGSVFVGLRKMVRESAAALGKEIELRAEGMDVRADRLVLERVKGPIIHLLRNAIAHGIESAGEREAVGKGPCGVIEINVRAASDRLHISMRDDGRGLDRDLIVQAALKRGVLGQRDVESLSADDVVALVCRAGVTTSAAVDEVSGRGIGLADVSATIADLQGELRVLSEPGRGAMFEMQLPISMASSRLLLVACGDQRVAIPVHAVEELRRVRRNELHYVEGQQTFLMNDRAVRIMHLAHVLRLRGEREDAGNMLNVVVMKSGATQRGFIVDEFLFERDAIIKPIGGPGKSCALVSGGIILDDATPCIVVDAAELVRSEPSAADPVTLSAEPGRDETPANILVVDDSYTARTVERCVLESAGYRVRVAVDGVEAIELLHREPADLVITDVEMPRLDGFGLLERIRCEQTDRRTPVIIVSSMKEQAHLERGLALGADAYMIKQKFNHQDLLATIRRFV